MSIARTCFGFGLLSLLALAAVNVAVSTAHAQSKKEQAKKHYADGQSYFDEGRFAEAEAAFQRAYDASPHPIVLLSIAESRLGQGAFAGAVRSFERYLKEEPKAKNRAELEAKIAEIKAKPGKLAIRSQPVGATVRIDDKPVPGVTPTSVEVAPGPHNITLELEGYQPSARRIDVEYGSNEVLQFDLRPVEGAKISDLEGELQDQDSDALASAEDTDAGSDVPVGALVAGGVGAAGLISGVVFGLLALDAQSEFDENPTADTADRGETYALIADVSYGVAIAGAAAAVILWVTHDSTEEEAVETDPDAEFEEEDEWANVSVSPILSPNYAGLSTSLQF